MMVDVKTQKLFANVFWNSLCPHLFVCEKLTFLFGIQELSILVVFGPGAKCAKMGQVCQGGARHSTGAVLLLFQSYLQNVSLRCSSINLSQLKVSQTERFLRLKSLVATESHLPLCLWHTACNCSGLSTVHLTAYNKPWQTTHRNPISAN